MAKTPKAGRNRGAHLNHAPHGTFNTPQRELRAKVFTR